jgi:hypothetical protein
MRTYEEIRQSLRRQAVARLVGLGLLALVATSAMLYGLIQGGRALWAALTGPRTLVVQLAPATRPVRELHPGCAHAGCVHAAFGPSCDHTVHVEVPHVVVQVPGVPYVHRREHRRAHPHWHYRHWSW